MNSKSTLHRKLKSLTGLSPGEFMDQVKKLWGMKFKHIFLIV